MGGMPPVRLQKPKIPCLAWALLISALLHALLVLLVSRPVRPAGPETQHAFVFHARMLPAQAAPEAPQELQLEPPPEIPSPLPSQPPPPLRALESPVTAPTARYYEVHELDSVPAPRQEIVPLYPPAALASRLSGLVQLEMYIDEAGEIQSVQVLRATTPGIFDQAALDAFRGQPFSPGTRNGQPVRTHLRLIVNFGDHPAEALDELAPAAANR